MKNKGRKKVFTDDTTKHQRYYAKNKEKRLTQVQQRRKTSPWEKVFYAMVHACNEHNSDAYKKRVSVEFSKENFKAFYETNSKGMEHPQVHRLDAEKSFTETNTLIIERKWFPYISGKSVEEKKKLIEKFRAQAKKETA